MKPPEIMLVAGEASGDMLAAEVVHALRREFTSAPPFPTPDLQPLRTGLEPRFFGAGGPSMKSAGVDLAVDMTEHAVIGVWDVVKNARRFRRLFRDLLKLAVERRPDVIIGVDYGGFNLRFARAVRRIARRQSGPFRNWQPRIVQLVSPQVWASRAGRAYDIAENCDLLLSIFPFEKEWYAAKVPDLRVEFIGHPMLDRFAQDTDDAFERGPAASEKNELLLLPGSRRSELKRHVPVMLAALDLIRKRKPGLRARMVLPDEELAGDTRAMASAANVPIQAGNLAGALRSALIAISKTGTITMECALFRVPAVTLYKTSWINYEIAKRVVKIKSLTMPNLLSSEPVYPEFIQSEATPENIARAALDLLESPARRADIQQKLGSIVDSLGSRGAATRAAKLIVDLIATPRT